MSGKGNSKRGSNNNKGASSSGAGGSGGNSAASRSDPSIVSGWEYHTYSQNSDRYVYIGKDEDGTPEFLDYGPKGAR